MLEGYKTYIGGAGFILSGLGNACVNYYNNATIDWNIVVGQITTGLSIIGIGAKLERKL